MPAPDPEGVWIEPRANGVSVRFYCYLWTSKDGHRVDRAKAIARRVQRGDWQCRNCGDELPAWRRADAQYCSEGCRKKVARARRKARE